MARLGRPASFMAPYGLLLPMADDRDDPFARLTGEHEDFLDKLSELEATLDEMMATREARDANIALLDETLRFLEDELLPHFRREERAMLPPLEAKLGRFGSLVNVVAYEHDEIRREIGKLEGSLAALKAKLPAPHFDEIQEINRHGIFTIQFLWNHFRKEQSSLFPTARQELSREELHRIRSDLADH